ncbi:MAG: hypothetical protein AAF559_10915 [Pseudomonadota bacterium]
MTYKNTRRFALFAALGALAACEKNTPEDSVQTTPPGGSDSAQTQVSPAAQAPSEATIDAALEGYSDFGEVNYETGAFDLDADGVAERFFYLTGVGVCGSGGCPLIVLRETDAGPVKLGKLTVSRLPVGVFSTQSEGLRDLAVTIGGGGLEYAVAKLPFDGSAYASNPTVAPAAPSKEPFETVIAMPKLD